MTTARHGVAGFRAGGRVAYAALFVVVLPALLVLWARRLDELVRLPAYGSPVAGIAIAACGIAMMVAGTAALWSYGRGLPMSPFPPERLVTRGIYRFVAHPLYVGAVATTAGASLATRSAAGLWIVTSTLALAAATWVLGFERDATRRRFGSVDVPLLRIPDDGDAMPTAWDRASVYTLVLIPWLLLSQAVGLLGAPPDALSSYLAIDARIPVIPWTAGLYAFGYPFVLIAPLAARRRRDLRRFAMHGLRATALIIPICLLIPLIAEAKPVPDDGFWQAMLRVGRTGNQPATAFPAWHVVWTFLAADLYAATWRSGRLAWLLAAAIGGSCLTVGMHGVADVAAGVAMLVLIRLGSVIWMATRRVTEAVANSWREIAIGPLRLMSHGLFAGLGVAVGFPIAAGLGGQQMLWWIFVATVVGGLGAGIWAQVIEGSPQLLRPFGYFGGLLGVVATAIVAELSGTDGWLLIASYCVAVTFGQAVARIRCLVNGCCHGRPAPEGIGIRYTHPRTRVVRLSGLGGVPIHPTPLYALIWTAATGLALLRLWWLGAPLSFIAGCYFILIGLGRFVEEHLRGEPQTPTFAGLRLYQWLSIAFMVGGAAVTAVRTNPAPAAHGIDWKVWSVWTAAATAAALCVAAFGVDFPRSNVRYSRLV